ncbi:N-carbamoylputrescine amidase [Kluyvera cryocrescens]|uniref:N-carbamoylputrescine amidase n=1 Tax=Kluyvera cryocrescens TaxID=580 RepID=A0A485CKN4_KLUCR|nr:N-carbamoylputrescine amidase [Kluyvera cryocrescens]
MTCYDLRFPDMALALALQGAEVLVLPAAWGAWPAEGTSLVNAARRAAR